jgi:surface carbohydrate biosynthesis protein (TIGR04326 family)
MPDGNVNAPAGTGVTLLVWDAEGSPPEGDWTTVLWRRYSDAEDSKIISIAQRVEQDADELRARYLAWIYDLGETRIDGRRVIDHLSLRNGFSYWWMSSLAQKFNVAEGSSVNDAIKALALEILADTVQTKAIVLASDNRRLADCIEDFCSRKQLRFKFRQTSDDRAKGYRHSLYQSLPDPFRGLIYLGWYIWKATSLLLKKKAAIPPCLGEILFIDVLVHLDKRGIENGRFVSNYWTALVGKLQEWKIKSNWLHNFFRHPAIPSLAQAQWQIDRFNATSNGSQFHVVVESSLNWRTLASTVRDYFKLIRLSGRLHGIRSLRPAGSSFSLWPLHAEAWGDSLRGKDAMVNCLRLSLFEEAVSRFPPQRVGIYIAENQPWEMALVHAWKAAGHGTLIGTPHTTIRFWDLRYHYDSRSYLHRAENDLPLPDILAVNGPVARESILASGYSSNRVVEVEALRFLHLSKPRTGGEHNCSHINHLRVLVCGDFLAEANRRMIAWLEIAARALSHDTTYVFKPHPAYPLSIADYPAFKMEIREEQLADLLADCDVVFASSITSSAVDAYCSGVPVIQMLDGNSFNSSPLRGLTQVTYVRDPSELVDALRSQKQKEYVTTAPYFNLDENLPRWQNLLAPSAANQSRHFDFT